jgi:23S rRNA (pseudouridine1915-N3)-methyltransferase
MAQAISEYERRAGRYWPLDVREVREARGIPAGRRQAEEWSRLAAVADGAEMVVCQAGGEQLTSEAFAAWLEERRQVPGVLAFVIGGAFGLPVGTPAGAAPRRLSLAPWTLPHELARLVLAEQLYRAGTIVRREPYHK